MFQPARWFLFLLLLLFQAPLASAWPPTYGPEFTFSRVSADETDLSDEELFQKLKEGRNKVLKHYEENCAALGCTVENNETGGRDGRGLIRVRYHDDGFWFDVGYDPNTLEVRTKPGTLAEFKRQASRIQRDVFDVMENEARLYPRAIQGGGGHLNIGKLSAFGKDSVLLRNYLVDKYLHHQELASAIHGLDVKNAIPFSMLPSAQQQRFFSILAEFDASVKHGMPWSLERLAYRISNEVLFKNPFDSKSWDPWKYQEKRLDRLYDTHIPESQHRLEDRARTAQGNMQIFLDQIEIEDGNLAYLRSLGHTLVSSTPSPLAQTQAAQLEDYFQYVQRAKRHLPPEDAAALWERAEDGLASSFRSLALQMKLRQRDSGAIKDPVVLPEKPPGPPEITHEDIVEINRVFGADARSAPIRADFHDHDDWPDGPRSQSQRQHFESLLRQWDSASQTAHVLYELRAWIETSRKRGLDPDTHNLILDELEHRIERGIPDEESLILAQATLADLWSRPAPGDRAKLLTALRHAVVSPDSRLRKAALSLSFRDFSREFGSAYDSREKGRIDSIAEALSEGDPGKALDEIAHQDPRGGHAFLTFADIRDPAFYRLLALSQFNLPEGIWSALVPKSHEALMHLNKLSAVTKSPEAREQIREAIRSAQKNPLLMPALLPPGLPARMRCVLHDLRSGNPGTDKPSTLPP